MGAPRIRQDEDGRLRVEGGSGQYVAAEGRVLGRGEQYITVTCSIVTGTNILQGTITTSTKAPRDSLHRWQARVEDSEGRLSAWTTFTHRVPCAPVAVSPVGSPYTSDAGADVTVEWQRFGGCTDGSWRLVGSYDFEVSELTVTGNRASCVVSVPGDQVANMQITARYCDGTEAANCDSGTATIQVGDPLVLDLPDRFEVPDYWDGGGSTADTSWEIERYVSGAIGNFRMAELGTWPANLSLRGGSLFARYRITATSVTGDETVRVRASDDGGRTAEDSTTVGIRAYGGVQINFTPGIDSIGNLYWNLWGRRTATEELYLRVPPAYSQLVRIGAARFASTRYDAAVVALKLSLDDLLVRYDYQVEVLNQPGGEGTALATLDGYYQPAPIFEVSFTRKALRPGGSARLVLTSFPSTSDPRVDEDSIRVTITDSLGNTPDWVDVTIATGGSPISILFSPPPGIELGTYEFDLSVGAIIDHANLLTPTFVEFDYKPAGSDEVQDSGKKAKITIGVVSVTPLRIVCSGATFNTDVPQDQLFGWTRWQTIGTATNATGAVSVVATELGRSSELGLDAAAHRVTAGGEGVTLFQIRYRNFALASIGDAGGGFFLFRLEASDDLSEDSCSGTVTFFGRD